MLNVARINIINIILINWDDFHGCLTLGFRVYYLRTTTGPGQNCYPERFVSKSSQSTWLSSKVKA